MISIVKMNRMGIDSSTLKFLFEFEFDNSSTLPEKAFAVGSKTYLIADGSTAQNIITSTRYEYNKGKWTKLTTTSENTTNTNKITDNGNYSFANNDSAGFNDVTVDVAGGGGGGSVEAKDVNFYDYDGTIVNSYTATEFAELSELPANPTHEGLTAQGWNWSLEDAKTYVAAYGKLDIGQMYASNTIDGKTYLHIRLGEVRLKPYLGLTGNSSGTAVSIDWGDNSTTESVTLDTSTIYTPHEYASEGEYVIAITVTSGSISLNSTLSSTNLFRKSSSADWADSDNVYVNILTKAEIGTGVTSIGDYAFQKCFSLTSITIPSGVTSIGNYAFSGCSSLTSITIPSEVTSIGDYAFNGCSSLTSITIPSEVTSIGDSTIQYCYSLTSITLPSGVTSIRDNAFGGCSSLTSITLPSGVTSIGSYAFSNCYPLTSITIPSGVTSIGSYAFQKCSSLTSITIPSGVTSIGQNASFSCSSLTSITIPSGVTSIGISTFNSCSSLTSVTISSGVTSIGNYAFNGCYSLTSVTIPSTVTSIGNNAFSSASGLGFIKFGSTTPPTVSAASAWTKIPTDCIIYVPTGSLSTYTSASYYPSSSQYTYEEY